MLSKPISKKTGQCPKCQEKKDLTYHHILPQRHYGNGKNGNHLRIPLCRACHNQLEKKIPRHLQEHLFYFDVLINFLGEETPEEILEQYKKMRGIDQPFGPATRQT